MSTAYRESLNIYHNKCIPNSLASPKSAIFRMPFLLRSKLVSFRSRWMTNFWCAKLISRYDGKSYSFYQLERKTLYFPLRKVTLVNTHLFNEFVQIDVAVFKHQKHRLLLCSHCHVSQMYDVRMLWEHS